nr:hypothetical protein [Tanacetum cinerariifolium]
HIDHICEEVSSVHSKLGDMLSFIVHQIFVEIKSSLPALVTTTLKEQMRGLLLDALKDTLPQLIKDSIKSSVLKSITEELPHIEAHKELSKSLQTNIRTSIKLKDMVSLLESAEVFKKANAKGDKWEKSNPETPKDTDFSHTPLRESTPTRVKSKGKGIATEEPLKDIMSFMEEGEQELRKMFNQATLKGRSKKWHEHKAKKVKIIEEYNHLISFRADPLLITKISYVVNTNKEATIKITRGDNPLNLIVHLNFRIRTLGFSEWLEVHALASKKTGKLNDMLLQSLRAKF